MDLREVIKQDLNTARMMQVATVKDNQPWNCTVYFAVDDNLNLYWISKPEARHSQEIKNNSKVAVAIPVKFDDLTVRGISLEGQATEVVSTDEIKEKVKLYSDKFNRGEDWYKDFAAGNNPHKLYRIKPTKVVLFDRVNFPDNDRQEIIL
ncbi:MAG TPA: pyridoxamine 5'-phosphate oxidase family protein [Patescibacteria group bacterium]|nr:pyridoxamine 5'-phosphate oxidase family protein [Patescibacteria group bacterium]